MIKTVLFFRKPFPGYHSIEELFGNIVKHLPEDVAATTHVSRYASTGIIKRMYNLWEARKFQQEVNHITGDVHYVAYFLKKKKTKSENGPPNKEAEATKPKPSGNKTYESQRKVERVLRSAHYTYKKVKGVDAKVTQLIEANGHLIAAGLSGRTPPERPVDFSHI
jgi:hypothetical protein